MRTLLCLCLCLQLLACKSPEQWVRHYKLTPVSAPSREFPPGTIVKVINKDNFSAKVICTPEEVLGPDFKPMVSNTVQINDVKRSKKAAKASIDVASLAGGNVDVHAIKSAQVVVANPQILYVSVQQVARNLANISKGCFYALDLQRRLDPDSVNKITMISRVVQADAKYSVEWNDEANLDINAKVVQLANLAADLQLEASRSGTQSMTATGVYWGVNTDKTLMALVNRDIIQNTPADGLMFPSLAEKLGKAFKPRAEPLTARPAPSARRSRSRPISLYGTLHEASSSEALAAHDDFNTVLSASNANAAPFDTTSDANAPSSDATDDMFGDDGASMIWSDDAAEPTVDSASSQGDADDASNAASAVGGDAEAVADASDDASVPEQGDAPADDEPADDETATDEAAPVRPTPSRASSSSSARTPPHLRGRP